MKRAATIFVATIAVIAIAAIFNAKQSNRHISTHQTDSSPTQPGRGEYLARAGNCIGCHTAQGGRDYAGGRKLPTPFGTFYTPNITPDRETGIGSWTSDDFWAALHNGESPDGRMLYPTFPYTEYTKVTREDSDAIFLYLRSVPAVIQRSPAHEVGFPYNVRPLLYVWRALYFRPGVYEPEPAQGAEWNRGAYLVQGLGHCNACHGNRNALGATRGAALGGGQIAGLNWYAPSLVSRTEAGTADWQVDDIVKLLATGIASRGVASGPMAEVVRASLQYLTANDLRAIAVYLKSLPENTAAIAAPLPETSDDMRKQFARGAAVYEKNCEDCHGSSGEGAPAAYPALAANRGVTMRSPLNSIRSVLNGGYPPSTAGNPRPYGMPPFAQSLSGDEIAAVLSYVRNAWGNRASFVSTLEVERSRGAGY